MNVRKIREDLGRARTCAQRKELPRAIYLLCMCLKDLGAQAAPMDLRGDIRTTLADICADPVYKKEFSQPQSYQAGKERELLVFFNKFYKQLMGAEEKEDREAALQRKINLDRCIVEGKKLLAQGRFSEADDSFSEAFKYYKNEFAAYGMMARAMMDAGQYVRALGYLRKGLQERADSPDLRKMAEECLHMRGQNR